MVSINSSWSFFLVESYIFSVVFYKIVKILDYEDFEMGNLVDEGSVIKSFVDMVNDVEGVWLLDIE